MSGAVCPSCGIAVVPGYVRCPKCQQPLPRHRAPGIEGGTAVATPRRSPLLAIIGIALVAIAFVVYFGLRSSSKPPAKPAAPAAVNEPPPAPAAIPAEPQIAAAPEEPAGPDPQQLANDLRRTLERQRLWAQVTIVGDHVDVQSSSCGDPAMAPVLDAAAPSFKAAGLTRLRCLEQSGRVVTERGL